MKGRTETRHHGGFGLSDRTAVEYLTLTKTSLPVQIKSVVLSRVSDIKQTLHSAPAAHYRIKEALFVVL